MIVYTNLPLAKCLY